MIGMGYGNKGNGFLKSLQVDEVPVLLCDLQWLWAQSSSVSSLHPRRVVNCAKVNAASGGTQNRYLWHGPRVDQAKLSCSEYRLGRI